MSYEKIMQKLGRSYNAGALVNQPISRRRFMKIAGVSGLALGIAPVAVAEGDAEGKKQGLTPLQQPSEFLQIAEDGSITIIVNRLEFGQGSHTGLARVLADELDADWSKVDAKLANAGDAYKDPLFGIQFTGGSTAIAHSFTQYRELGARARAMLLTAAAEKWEVDVSALSTNNGKITGPNGKEAGFGELAVAAMSQPVPEKVELKTPDQFRYIGKGVERLDTRNKSTGQQDFGIDARRPGMKTVLLIRPPWFGGKVESFDASAASSIQGVDQIMKVDLDRDSVGIAVIADGYWQAKMGRDAVKVEWQHVDDIDALPDTTKMAEQFTELLGTDGLKARTSASLDKEVAKTISADFTFPFLAHTPMEPLNALIEMTGSGENTRVDVWTGTQFQTFDQGAVAGVLDVSPAQVTIHTQFAGGGFGRRATPTSDYLADTAKVMKAWTAAGRTEPLKVMWSREDDVRGGYYRPFTMHRASIGLSDDGDVVSWDHTIVAPSILKGTAFEPMLMKDGIDSTATEGVADSAYDLPISVDVHHPVTAVPVLWWRSVGHTHSAFVMETLVEQIARAGGVDAVDFRRKHLAKHPRHLAALDLAVEKSGYGERTLPDNQAWGVAVHESFGSVVAHIVEVSMDGKNPVVHKVTSAIHCNTAVNPRSVEAQIQGAAIMGIGMLLSGAEITLKQGQVQQSNFHNYSLPRMPVVPEIAVYIVPSQDPPTGVGEPGLPPIAPAIANAMLALTGEPVTTLPIQST
ncbi:MAG: xanthine dehydrogenase family protein molybdopterin-binding subunit [Acidiferrobacterales bacterium]|nr:xanthine dehydrogenase family protein molybdopterin-binding subunit [Acidiferrobacterales bacterium]